MLGYDGRRGCQAPGCMALAVRTGRWTLLFGLIECLSRFYIVQGGKLVYKAAPTDAYTYSVEELRTRLAACLQG